MNLPVVKPQLAFSTKKPPSTKNFIHEIKYDGFRMMVYVSQSEVRILTRNGHDWTDKFPSLISSIKKFNLKNAIFDGEIVVLNKKSRSDFHLLQNAIHKNNDEDIIYYIFDLLYLNDVDSRKLPLIERKNRLKKLFSKKTPSNIQYSHYISGDGNKIFSKVFRMGLEGIISKKIDAPYCSGRNKNWLKCKCYKQDKFILIGYLTSKNKVTSFLLAEKNNKKLKFCGRISADFMNVTEPDLKFTLKKLLISEPCFIDVPRFKNAYWLQPHIYLTIKYIEKTQDGCLRQAILLGVDKIL